MPISSRTLQFLRFLQQILPQCLERVVGLVLGDFLHALQEYTRDFRVEVAAGLIAMGRCLGRERNCRIRLRRGSSRALRGRSSSRLSAASRAWGSSGSRGRLFDSQYRFSPALVKSAYGEVSIGSFRHDCVLLRGVDILRWKAVRGDVVR